MMLNKDQLRHRYSQIRNNIDPFERQKKGEQIKQRLCQTAVWQQSSHIAAYSALGAEVATKPIIEQAWAEGKAIYLPKTDSIRRQLSFYQVTPRSVLKKGAYGILEPSGEERPLQLEDLDCILIPGLMFDLWGYRLGYGGGYYDRFLPLLPQETVIIGLAYQAQLFPRPIPREKFDQPVDLVITEEQVLNCAARRSEQ